MKRMNEKATRTFIVLIIVLTVILQPLTLRVGASQDFQLVNTYWGSAANPSEVGPGDKSVTLNVVVQNIGYQTYSGLDALLYLSFPFSDITGGNIAHGSIGQASVIPAGQISTLQFQLNIDGNASIGSYSPLMALRYGPGLSFGETLYVNVLVLGRVQFEISVDPPFLLAGSVNKLTINVSNKGTATASKVSVTVNSASALSLTGDNHRYFPSIAPRENETMIFSAYAQPVLAGSSLQIGTSITYTDAYGTGRAANPTVGLMISPTIAGYTGLTVSEIFWGSRTVPIDVQPGDDNQPLNIVILNSGTVLAQNVTATLLIESPFSYQHTSNGETIEDTNQTSSIGTIMPSASGLAKFTLSIRGNSTSGLYKLTIILQYLGNSPIETTVDIPVKGYSEMAMQKVSILPSKVYPGDRNVDLKVFVTNAGNAAAHNVSIKIMRAQYVTPSWGGADSFFIGTVQAGQVIPADFYIDVNESAPSPSYPTLIAKIVYGSESNFQNSEEIPLFLSAKSRFVVTQTQIPEIHVSDTGIVIPITFKNIGAETAQGTTVQLEVSNILSGTTNDYLGTMELGKERTATFILNVDSNAKIGSHTLNQKISWTQTGSTELFTQDLSLQLNILENPLGKLLPIIIMILLVMVAAVIILYGVRRRSRGSKMRPTQT